MIKISLTDFVDFVISSGTPKLTKVRQLKRRGEYRPAFDYWKNLRDEIIDFHKRNMNDKSRLDEVLESVVDEKKIGGYKECLRGYKRFIGKKKYKEKVKKKLFLKDCVFCGKEFITSRVNTINCSKECAYERIKLSNRRYQRRVRSK